MNKRYKNKIIRLFLVFVIVFTYNNNCLAKDLETNQKSSNDIYISSEAIPNSVQNYVKEKSNKLLYSVSVFPDMYDLNSVNMSEIHIGQLFTIFNQNTGMSTDAYYFPVINENNIFAIISATSNDSKIYRNKGLRFTCIKTIMGDIEFERCMYEFKTDDGKKAYKFLLDEYLQMNGI